LRLDGLVESKASTLLTVVSICVVSSIAFGEEAHAFCISSRRCCADSW
jgi:hypothetical protein